MQSAEFVCSRCRQSKPARQFNPRFEGSVLVRADACASCQREILEIREQHRRQRGIRKGPAPDPKTP